MQALLRLPRKKRKMPRFRSRRFTASGVVSLFTANSAVIILGIQYLRGYIWDSFLGGIHFSFSGYFCALGKSRISFLHNLLSIVLVRVPDAYFMSKLFPENLFPMGIATACGSLLSVIVCVIAFLFIRKKCGMERKVISGSFDRRISTDRRFFYILFRKFYNF